MVFLTILIQRACLVVAPFCAAKVITELTHSKHENALIWLSVGMGFMIFRNIILHINYILYTAEIRTPYLRIQNEIVQKVFRARSANFQKVQKGQFINMIHSDVLSLCDVLDLVATKLANLLQVFLTVGTLMFLNYYIGLLMVGVCVVNFFILNFINNRIAETNKRTRFAVDKQLETFGNLFDAKDGVVFEDTKEYLQKQFRNSATSYMHAKHRQVFFQSVLENWYFAFYNGVVFVITFALILLVGRGQMTLELYLLTVPYLLIVIEACNSFFDMFKDVKNAHVYMNRIKKVLTFTDKEEDFGSVEPDFDYGGIDFVNVSANYKSYPPVKNINFHIRANEITLINGAKASGKRSIYHMLMRDIPPQRGQVLISGIDVGDYDKASYKRQLNTIVQSPYFIKASIMKVLRIFEPDRKKIVAACQDFGIHDAIMALHRGYESDASTLQPALKHMLAFVRAILAKCEILLFYETPNTLNDADRENLKRNLKKWGETKTIVLFSRSMFWADICQKVIEIDNGEVRNISFTEGEPKTV